MKKYISLYSYNGEIKGEYFEKKHEAIDRCRDFPYLGKQFSICVMTTGAGRYVWNNTMLSNSFILKHANEFIKKARS